MKKYNYYVGKTKKSWFMEIGSFFLIGSIALFTKFIYDFVNVGKWGFDASAISFVNGIRNNYLNKAIEILTSTGNFMPTLIMAIIGTIILWCLYDRRNGLFFGINILGLWLCNELFKSIFKRQRPSGKWLVDVTGYSLPSGHAMIFMGMVLLLIYFIINNVRNKKVGVIISSLIFMYAILIGLSRVYVGVHYLSDVLIGWTLAVAWVSASLMFYRIIDR